MEKNIEVIVRYHYTDGYFVEVSQERSFTAKRDYWLCRRDNSKKLYMFSSRYKNADTEERQILKHIKESVLEYENPASEKRFA